jgi:hypothetical protein
MTEAMTRLQANDDFKRLLLHAGMSLVAGDDPAGRMAARELQALTLREEPGFARLLGTERMVYWLAQLTTATSALLSIPDVSPGKVWVKLWELTGNPFASTERLSADGHLTVSRDGIAQLESEATFTDFSDWQDYQTSLRPAGKRGRSRGVPKVHGSGKAPITEETARDALSLNQVTWATKHAPDLDLSDPGQANRARGRFNRARERGRLLQQMPKSP